MTSILRVIIVSAAVALLGVGGLAAQDDNPVSVSFDTTFVSKYIWRGQNLNDGGSTQPGIAIGYKGLTLSSWSQISHTAFGDSGIAGNHWTEHDFTLDYGFALNEKISLNVGWINYAFPNFNEGRFSNEIYGALSVDTILQPSIGVYGDPHNGNGMYYNFGVGHGVDLGNGIALSLSASIGINQHQWIDTTAVSDVVLGVGIDIPAGNHVTLSPFFNYITGDSSLRAGPDAIYYTGPIGGINVNITP